MVKAVFAKVQDLSSKLSRPSENIRNYTISKEQNISSDH